MAKPDAQIKLNEKMKEFEVVLNKMLSLKPDDRPTASKLIDHFIDIRKKLNPQWKSIVKLEP